MKIISIMYIHVHFLFINIFTYVYAGSINKNNTFTSGTVISSSQINSNFDQLFIELNAKETRLTTLESGGGSLWSINGTGLYYNAGNVGVGTSAPDTNLQVVGSAYIGGAAISRTYVGGSNNDTIPFLATVPANGATLATAIAGWGFFDSSIDGDLEIKRRPNINTTWVDTMTINRTSGNVGIRTTTPKVALHTKAEGLLWSTGNFIMEDSTGSNLFNFTDSGGVLYLGYNANSAGGYPQANYVQVLNVSGLGDLTVPGCVNYNGGTMGGCLSDERVKKDVQPFSLGMSQLLGMQPRTYKYNGLGNTTEDQRNRIGIIAQELEKVAPELVETRMMKLRKDDSTETELKMVNYGAFTYVIINAIKEIYHRWFDDSKQIRSALNRLELENKALQRQNRYILERLHALEKQRFD